MSFILNKLRKNVQTKNKAGHFIVFVVNNNSFSRAKHADRISIKQKDIKLLWIITGYSQFKFYILEDILFNYKEIISRLT